VTWVTPDYVQGLEISSCGKWSSMNSLIKLRYVTLDYHSVIWSYKQGLYVCPQDSDKTFVRSYGIAPYPTAE
jgi:hypothetical protein